MINYIITSSGLSFVYNGVPYSVDRTHVNYKKILEAVTTGVMDNIDTVP